MTKFRTATPKKAVNQQTGMSQAGRGGGVKTPTKGGAPRKSSGKATGKRGIRGR